MNFARGAWAIILLLLAAGCAGKPTAAPAPTEDDPYALGAGIENALQGIVLSADNLPLENVTMRIPALAENGTTSTNALGEFRFVNLVPRDYLVVAEKEGYRSKTQRAIVEDGKIFQLDFRLEERPTTTPYSEILPWRGFLSCQVAYASNPESVEKRDCGLADPNNDPQNDFHFGPGGAQLVIEANWVPTQDLSRNLSMAVASFGLTVGDIEFGSTTGPPGIKIPVGQSLVTRFFSEGGTIRVTLGAAPGARGNPDDYDVGWAIQQPVDVYVTVFYIDVGPTGYSAIP
jgi:hypothetical protein